MYMYVVVTRYFNIISIFCAAVSPLAVVHSMPVQEGNQTLLDMAKENCRRGPSGHCLERSQKVQRPFCSERSLQIGQNLEESSR